MQQNAKSNINEKNFLVDTIATAALIIPLVELQVT